MARLRSKKGTIVRTFTVPLRIALRTASSLAPGLAARVLERLWMTPMRPPVRPGQALAAPTRLAHGSGELPVWSFGEGPAVFLVHGWGGRAEQLLPFVQPLVASGHKVIVFDAPGHGRAPGRLSSAVAIAEALRSVVREHGPAHAIVAHSLGASAAALALARGLWARRVVFLGPPAHLPGYIERFGSALGASPEVVRRTRARVERRLKLSWSSLELEALANDQPAPLLVVHDRDDREVPVEEGRAMARTWPDAELELTSGLGHWRILRDPKVIGRVIEFIDRGRTSRLGLTA